MKEEMIKSSIRLFEQKGFSETSIQEIVEDLGVSKGTFYYYFSSKEQVLMMIHRKYIDHLIQVQQKMVNESLLTNREKLRGMIHMLITNIVPMGKSARVFHREFRHLSDEHMKEVREKRNQIRIGFEQVIKAGMENGEFRSDLEADIVTLGILGACNWGYQWFSPEGRYQDTQVADIFLDMVCRGIASK